jgi:hypothetical protein
MELLKTLVARPETSDRRIPVLFALITLTSVVVGSILSHKRFNAFFEGLGAWHDYVPRLSEAQLESTIGLIVQVQMALTGVVLPIAIALVTFTTERGARSTTLKIFLRRSCASMNFYSGLSLAAIALSTLIYLAAEVIILRGFFRFLTVGCITAWSVTNCVLTAWFMRVTIQYLSPEERSRHIVGWSVDEALLRGRRDAARGRAFNLWLKETEQSGYLRSVPYLLDNIAADVNVLVGRQGYVHRVREWMLYLIARVHKFRNGSDNILQVLPIGFGPANVGSDVRVIRANSKSPISTIQRKLISACYISRRSRQDSQTLDIQTIAAAVASEAIHAIRRNDVVEYEVHVGTWADIVDRVLVAEQDLKDVASSRDLFSDAFPLLSAAVDASLGGEEAYLFSLLRKVSRLSKSALKSSIGTYVITVRQVVDFYGYAYYQTQFRWAFSGESVVRRDIDVADPREQTITQFVGSWLELAVHVLIPVYVKASPRDAGNSLGALGEHLLQCVSFMVISAEFDDDVAARWWADSLLKWGGSYSHQFEHEWIAGFRVKRYEALKRLVSSSSSFGEEKLTSSEADETKYSAMTAVHSDVTLLAAAISVRQLANGRAAASNSLNILTGRARQMEGDVHSWESRTLSDPRVAFMSAINLLCGDGLIDQRVEQRVESWQTMNRRWVAGRTYSGSGPLGAERLVGEMAEVISLLSDESWETYAKDQSLIGWLASQNQWRVRRAIEGILSSLEARLSSSQDAARNANFDRAVLAVRWIRVELEAKIFEDEYYAVVDTAHLGAIASRVRDSYNRVSNKAPGLLSCLKVVVCTPPAGVQLVNIGVNIQGVSKLSVAVGSTDSDEIEQCAGLAATALEDRVAWLVYRAFSKVETRAKGLVDVLSLVKEHVEQHGRVDDWLLVVPRHGMDRLFGGTEPTLPAQVTAIEENWPYDRVTLLPAGKLQALGLSDQGLDGVKVCWTEDEDDPTKGTLRVDAHAFLIGAEGTALWIEAPDVRRANARRSE